MTSLQLEYSEAELLETDAVDEPVIAGGVRCHGGFTSAVRSRVSLGEGGLHYLFADTVHPTPHGYSLLARLVSVRMADKGWL